MMTFRKIYLTIILAMGLTVGLSACNTAAGVGEDVQKAGGAIEDAAES